MSNTSFIDLQKKYAADGAYRAATNQSLKVAKSAILTLLESQGFNEEKLETTKEILNNPLFEAAIRLGLGMGLDNAPVFSNNKKVKRVAQELQISGYAGGIDELGDFVRERLMPMITAVMVSLPDEEDAETTQLRVEPQEQQLITTPVIDVTTPQIIEQKEELNQIKV